MKIVEITCWQIDLPLVEGRYSWSNDNFVEVFDTTVIGISTDEGIVGYGECCPLGPAYLPAYAAGVRAGIAEIGPKLLGEDPRDLDRFNARMDSLLRGHPYVKSALDMACWDILGKASGLPVATLLGGIAMDGVPLYRAIAQRPPEEMAENVARYQAEGYTKFQLKVGGDADTDIARIRQVAAIMRRGDVLVADANTGWNRNEAMRVVNAVSDLDVYIEQPCPTYEECLSVRAHCPLPFILDEVVNDIHALTRAIADRAADCVNLKISKLGGLTRTRQLRDLCIANGIAMTIEDSWGGDIVTAAIAAIAQSCDPAAHFSSTDFNSYVTRSIGTGAPRRIDGAMSVSERPGLGVDVDPAELGESVFRIQE